MIRIGALLLLLLIAPGARPARPYRRRLQSALVTSVYATALSFMAPRTLEPVPVSQLTVWGLHGLTALDPDLNMELRDGQLLLAAKGRVLTRGRRPPATTSQGWATAAAELASAGGGRFHAGAARRHHRV